MRRLLHHNGRNQGAEQRIEELRHAAADLNAGLRAIADGDLGLEFTASPSRTHDDELDQVAAELEHAGASYNAARAALQQMVRELTETTATVYATSHELASNSDSASRAVTEIASAVSEVAIGAEAGQSWPRARASPSIKRPRRPRRAPTTPAMSRRPPRRRATPPRPASAQSRRQAPR